MRLKRLVAAVSAISMSFCLSGCFDSKYTSEYKNKKETVFTENAQAWFAENLPDASDITYHIVTTSYVTDMIHGEFVLDSYDYDYVWCDSSKTLYTNRLCDGTDYKVCKSRFENLIADMFHDTVEVDVLTFTWTLPCEFYSNRGVESDSDVKDIITDGSVKYSYFEWGTTQDQMWVWCEDVLSRRTDEEISLTASITYESYSDIEQELESQVCMKAYPGIDRITFKTDSSIDYYTMTRVDYSTAIGQSDEIISKIVSEWHHKIEKEDGTSTWVVDVL